MSDILHLSNLSRVYKTESESLTVLNGASFSISRGEICRLGRAVRLRKSTLLHLAGLLEKPDGGAVVINGTDAGTQPDADRTAIRLHTIGIVYQFHHLLAEFTALENIALPQMIARKSEHDANSAPWNSSPNLAWRRAPTICPANSPAVNSSASPSPGRSPTSPRSCWPTSPPAISTSPTADIVFSELIRIVRAENVAALIATHNPDLARPHGPQITLRDGKLYSS